MAVQALYALQNGFMGFDHAPASSTASSAASASRSRSPAGSCAPARPADSLRHGAVAAGPCLGLLRSDPLAPLPGEEDSLTHRPDPVETRARSKVDIRSVLCAPASITPGAPRSSRKSELIVQKDEYAYAHYPASFFESLLLPEELRSAGLPLASPGRRHRAAPGVTVLRTDGTHARSSVTAGRAARGQVRSSSRATLATGGAARRQGAGAWRRVESDASAPSRSSKLKTIRPAEYAVLHFLRGTTRFSGTLFRKSHRRRTDAYR